MKFYLTTGRSVLSNHAKIGAAKRAAARKVMRHRRMVIDVVERTKHGDYVLGTISLDEHGNAIWSPV